MQVHDGKPDLNEVCYAVGEGHVVGSVGHAYELNSYYRIHGDAQKYRSRLADLMTDITEKDLPPARARSLEVGFFDKLMDAYKNRAENRGKFLRLFAQAYNAKVPTYEQPANGSRTHTYRRDSAIASDSDLF